MKKWIAFIAITGLFAASCAKSNVPVQKDETKGTYVFTLNANLDEELTKSDYAADGKFSWHAGDKISVLFNDGAGNNKYYTLTAATGGAKSTTFSGTIDEGWVIGAADNGKKWALFPASDNHTYNSTTHFPKFHIPAETDFTAPGAHFSANIPMIAELPSSDETNSFTFNHGTTTFKFTFTDVDASKVKLIVSNNTSRILSGDIQVKVDGSRNYLSYSSSDSEGTTTIAFTEDVVSKTAVFYVPFRAYNTEFSPTLTLVNMDEGSNKYNTILSTTAKSDAFSNGDSGYSWNKLNVVPSVDAPGVGSPYVLPSKFTGVDWSSVSYPSGTGSDAGADYEGIGTFKATADSKYIYIYFSVLKSKLMIDADQKYANAINIALGKELNDKPEEYCWMWTPFRTADLKWGAWLLRYGNPYTGSSNSNNAFYGDYLYSEYRYARSSRSYLQTAGTAYVGVVLYYGKWQDGDSVEHAEHSKYMFAPKTSEGYLEVTMPEYSE